MPQKRIFIAINLPKHIRAALEKEIARLVLELPESVRFIPPEFLHFTLTFLGYQTDEGVGEIIAAMQEIVPQFAPPEIAFGHIAYGPVGAPARMIWAVTDEKTSDALGKIRAAFEDALAGRGVRFEREARKYIGHLTLARLPADRHGLPAEQAGFARMPELPEIGTPFRLTFVPETVDLMESRLTRSGAEYDVLTKVEFGT